MHLWEIKWRASKKKIKKKQSNTDIWIAICDECDWTKGQTKSSKKNQRKKEERIKIAIVAGVEQWFSVFIFFVVVRFSLANKLLLLFFLVVSFHREDNQQNERRARILSARIFCDSASIYLWNTNEWNKTKRNANRRKYHSVAKSRFGKAAFGAEKGKTSQPKISTSGHSIPRIYFVAVVLFESFFFVFFFCFSVLTCESDIVCGRSCACKTAVL